MIARAKKSTGSAGTPVRRARKWKRSPPALIEAFGTWIAAIPGAEPRKMFGCPAAFVNGHMFTALFEDRLILKLPAPVRTELAARKQASPFQPYPGRTMGEFVEVARPLLRQPTKLRSWMEQAYRYVASLPQKTQRPRRVRPKRTNTKGR